MPNTIPVTGGSHPATPGEVFTCVAGTTGPNPCQLSSVSFGNDTTANGTHLVRRRPAPSEDVTVERASSPITLRLEAADHRKSKPMPTNIPLCTSAVASDTFDAADGDVFNIPANMLGAVVFTSDARSAMTTDENLGSKHVSKTAQALHITSFR